MPASWFDHVDRYLHDLEQLAGGIDGTLKGMRLETAELNAPDVSRSNAFLMEQLAALEVKIADRETLLHAPEAPSRGRTLTDKLDQSENAQGIELADRCRAISAQISIINQRAVSLFVCQFHLAQLSADIVRLIAGHSPPPTYGDPSRAERKSDLGGGLFNEAA